MCLSGFLRVGLRDQCQAKRARHLDTARACRRRRDTRSRDGRPHRDERRWPRDRCRIFPRRALAVPAGAQRGGCGLCDRDAAPVADVGECPLSGRTREQFRPGRQEPHGAVEPGHLGRDEGGNPLVQGTAVACAHRALELHRQGQGLLRRLLLHEPGAAADRVGRDAKRTRAMGRSAHARDAEVQPSGRIEDRWRDAAAGAQPRDTCRREGSVRTAGRARHLFVLRQRQAPRSRIRSTSWNRHCVRPARARYGTRPTIPAT